MKKNSHRIIRINEEIKHELSNIIRSGLKDPRVDSMTSVVKVDTTPDLKFCKVYISVIGDEEKQNDTLEGIKHSSGFIRKEIARTCNLRNTPELHFVLDHSIEYGVHLSTLINDVAAHDEEVAKHRIEEADEDETV